MENGQEVEKIARTQPSKRRRKRSGAGLGFARLVIGIFLLLVCLGAAGVVVAAIQIPAQAARHYGPPGQGLSLSQQVIYGYRLLSNKENLLTPFDPGARPRTFTVALGEPVNSIAYRLEDELFIPNADAFRTYLIYAGLDTGVQAGKYQLSPAMNAVEIAQALQDAVPSEVTFNILAGWRAEEIAAALPTSGLQVTAQEFLTVVHDPSPDLVPAGLAELDSLEGFLLPGSYTLPRETSAQKLVVHFTGGFSQALTPDLQEAFENQGLTIQEAVILASIVQREAVVEEEQPLIASVFYNRLAIGMRLESDPTVQYALGYLAEQNTWWKNPLSMADLQFDSGYNTYVYAGLPPGPICNPGLQALRAVAYTAQTGYYFFRAHCDGSGRH